MSPGEPAPGDIDRDLQGLATEMRRLEAEYNMFFGGRSPRPPLQTRARVAAWFKRYERGAFESVAQRFRFNTLQARFTTFAELWDRGLRAREEGRTTPFTRRAVPAADARPAERTVHVTALAEPAREAEKLRGLYEAVASARRETGQAAVPYERFADHISQQVSALRANAPEVAFRVTVKDGKVSLTATVTKGGTS
jgi:hypothetical protein